MTLQFKKAQKSVAKLRLALAGPSGSGKTYTALAVGSHMGKRLAVIDTEKESSQLYADKFAFDALTLDDYAPETYVKAIRLASELGYDVLVIDSISHAWEALKDRVDGIAKAKFKGNSWGAWSELTPIQNALIRAVLDFPGHVICTMRTKTAWELEKDERSGKTKPIKVGLAPIQREDVSYEFTIVLDMSDGGLARVSKTRWSEIQDHVIEKPGEKFAKGLLEWLNTGTPVVATTPIQVAMNQGPGDPFGPDESHVEVRAEIETLLSRLTEAWREKTIAALGRAGQDYEKLAILRRVVKTEIAKQPGPPPGPPTKGPEGSATSGLVATAVPSTTAPPLQTAQPAPSTTQVAPASSAVATVPPTSGSGDGNPLTPEAQEMFRGAGIVPVGVANALAALPKAEESAAGPAHPSGSPPSSGMRHMSFSMTTKAFLDGTKSVTRRLGWASLKVGDRLIAVEKSQGLKKGERVRKLGPIEIVSVRRERLDAITDEDVKREGFADLSRAAFVLGFEKAMGCKFWTEVTRIEFKRLPPFESHDDVNVCTTCGNDGDWEECDQCGGDGYVEDNDPLDETQTYQCGQCEAKGGWPVCWTCRETARTT